MDKWELGADAEAIDKEAALREMQDSFVRAVRGGMFSCRDERVIRCKLVEMSALAKEACDAEWRARKLHELEVSTDTCWNMGTAFGVGWRCSYCGFETDDQKSASFNYCPSCGRAVLVANPDCSSALVPDDCGASYAGMFFEREGE